MEEKRVVKLTSRFSLFELGLLIKIAEIEQRKKADMLRELIRRDALRKGLITTIDELREDSDE